MALINVNRGTSDMFYRYKMPVLIAKVRVYNACPRCARPIGSRSKERVTASRQLSLTWWRSARHLTDQRLVSPSDEFYLWHFKVHISSTASPVQVFWV